MKEITANLWEVPADLRVITTNGATRRDGACVMGRGCAYEAKSRYPGIDHRLGDLIKRYGNRVMRLGRYGAGGAGVMIASFPVKHHWRQEADPNLIRCSARQLVALADKFGYENVVLPRPGCGAGRLAWRDIRPILDEKLDGRFTVATFPRKPLPREPLPREQSSRKDDARGGSEPEGTASDESGEEERILYAIVCYSYDSPDDLGRGRYRRTVHEGDYEEMGEAATAAFRLGLATQTAGGFASAFASFDVEEYPESLGKEHARPVKLRNPKGSPWMTTPE